MEESIVLSIMLDTVRKFLIFDMEDKGVSAYTQNFNTHLHIC